MDTLQREPTTTIIIPNRLAQYRPHRSWRQRTLWGLFVLALIIMDLFMMGSAFAFAWVFHPGSDVGLLVFLPAFSALILPLWFLIFGITGLYTEQNLLNGYDEYALVLRGVTTGMLSVVVASFVRGNTYIDEIWLLTAWALAAFLACLGRFLMRRIIFAMRRRGYFLAPTVIVGANEESLIIAEQLKRSQRSGLGVIGFVDDEMAVNSTWATLPILGTVDQLELLILRHNIEEVILTTSAFSKDELLSLFKRYGIADNINLRFSSGLFEIITTGLEVKQVAGVPLTQVNRARLTGVDKLMKRALDLLITVPGLIAISPVLLIIAIIIKYDSPGPVFYKRRVMGVNGRVFDAYKFRTMHINGDEILAQHPELQEELARTHKLKEDPRITHFGRILRKTSFDELPQLFNVFKNDMSLVGPRMITPNEIKMYNRWDINLLTVRPGITGLWQVSGRSDISYEERVRLDMFYIRNWSIGLDLELLIRTIPVVFKGHGAY